MGKMTDALEVLCNSYFRKTGNIAEVFQRIQDFHQQIIRDLFGSADSEVNARVLMILNKFFTPSASLTEAPTNLYTFIAFKFKHDNYFMALI